MSQPGGSFRPDELAGPDPCLGDAELATAWSVARELQAALPPETVGPSAAFSDRVMAAVALEPTPRRAGFLVGLRARPGFGGFVASLRDAWIVARGGAGRPAGARGLALAYVLAVVLIGSSLTGIAAFGAAGALGILDGDDSSSPSAQPSIEPGPTPSRSPAAPDVTRTPEPSETAEPSDSAEPEPSDSAEPTRDPTPSPRPHPSATIRPTSSPEASDEHGGESPHPGGDDEHSPKPGDWPHQGEWPKP